MVLSDQDRLRYAELLRAVDAHVPRIFDMIGVGIWSCQPPVYMRTELQYIRGSHQKVVYAAYGLGAPQAGQGVDLLLTCGVHRPQDYTGGYAGGGADVKLRGVGYGVGFATSLPPGDGAPWGVSIGLSSPGLTWWFCQYRIIGQW